MESAYTFLEYRYRFLKESKESFKTGNKVPGVTKRRTSYNLMEESFLETIRQEVMCTKIKTKDIISRCASISYEVYKEETKRLSKEKLQNWLWEAQQRDKKQSRELIKKVKEAERKKQIILEKNERIRKVSQEVETMRSELKKVKLSAKNFNKRKGVNRKKSVTEIQVDQLPIDKIDTSLYQVTPIEILVYDIPA
ncbi:unnamed protein product [Rhizophagus irregularis]|uniref:Uncharacterized protein n=1 Tax=Rhizophagus irregularis TaxID=588596 RepID=A0A2I1HU44_9GLOM|nr:hypothetical protein RhiirA4_526882 [Rhizophagus irregularis]CAB4418679.1 unnamed protein product [Rhizophagus irregularis]